MRMWKKFEMGFKRITNSEFLVLLMRRQLARSDRVLSGKKQNNKKK